MLESNVGSLNVRSAWRRMRPTKNLGFLREKLARNPTLQVFAQETQGEAELDKRSTSLWW
ncbi:MAG: hypothetical protein NWE81_02290 [Candidatus Bathyarchaeota archaeon]|nr:hypothetical protein [Candidatus Bathyarchaeota archaeon]